MHLRSSSATFSDEFDVVRYDNAANGAKRPIVLHRFIENPADDYSDLG